MLRLRATTTAIDALLLDSEWQTLAIELRLSPRELEIVRGVFADDKELAIAAQLGVSTHTVHTHLKRIYEKLGVSSRVELVVRVFREYIALARRKALPRTSAPAIIPFKAAA